MFFSLFASIESGTLYADACCSCVPKRSYVIMKHPYLEKICMGSCSLRIIEKIQRI